MPHTPGAARNSPPALLRALVGHLHLGQTPEGVGMHEHRRVDLVRLDLRPGDRAGASGLATTTGWTWGCRARQIYKTEDDGLWQPAPMNRGV